MPMTSLFFYRRLSALVLFACGCFSLSCLGGDTPIQNQAAAAQINAGDNAWLLVSSAMVLMMTAPGLVLFYGGLVRRKNVLSTMAHSMILMAMVSMLWMVYGYSMAFGTGNAFFGNPLQFFMLRGVGAA